jgi:UDP-GlcNAc:undecaprenyl-phosphate GlcNAc-1-phosphate transferase
MMIHLGLSKAALYALTFSFSLLVSVVLTPVMRAIALKFNILDYPHSDIKTHKNPTPYLGGIAIWLGWMISLFAIRFFTHFPTGTLRSLRGIIFGSLFILILGLIDDTVPKGLGFKKKFAIQIMAAVFVLAFDVRLHFIQPYFMAAIMSIIWVVGVTNAFNIIDIMDGLSSGLAVIASLALLFIALPSEQIFVNFCAAALAGGCIGFMPYNLSSKLKIFMGDAGSLTIGFILAALCMGTSYTQMNEIGLFSPLLILAIPLYDTILVSIFRLQKGQSPFIGSKDHFALRLEIMGFKRSNILLITYFFSVFLSVGAYFITRVSFINAIFIFLFVFILAMFVSYKLSLVEVN